MYAKVFTSMYDGTLVTRGPWEALVTFQQLLILADKEGDVDKTPEVISRITTIPLDIIQKGIKALMEPDPYSRSPLEDGRRIVPINPSRPWGWKIVNYKEYRDMRSADERRAYMRKYHQEYRKQNKQNKHGVNSVNNLHRFNPSYSEASSSSSSDTDKELKNKKETTSCSNSENLNGVEVITELEFQFNQFWKAYPKKQGKGICWKWWKKRKPSQELLQKMLTTIKLFSQSDKWQEGGGQYIPMPSTWLNQERWDDELPSQENIIRSKGDQHYENVRRATMNTLARLTDD